MTSRAMLKLPPVEQFGIVYMGVYMRDPSPLAIAMFQPVML